jgi:hypothetical protein
MRYLPLLFFVAVSAQAQNLFVFSKDGKTILCNPREIPANAVTITGRQPVLGMHSATPAVKAACGWYRVVQSTEKPAKNQYVAARSYVISGYTALETVVVSNRVKRTAKQRLDQIFNELNAETEDEKVKAVIAQIAKAVADRISDGVAKENSK